MHVSHTVTPLLSALSSCCTFLSFHIPLLPLRPILPCRPLGFKGEAKFCVLYLKMQWSNWIVTIQDSCQNRPHRIWQRNSPGKATIRRRTILYSNVSILFSQLENLDYFEGRTMSSCCTFLSFHIPLLPLRPILPCRPLGFKGEAKFCVLYLKMQWSNWIVTIQDSCQNRPHRIWQRNSPGKATIRRRTILYSNVSILFSQLENLDYFEGRTIHFAQGWKKCNTPWQGGQ